MGLDWDEGPEVGGKEDSYYQSERIDLYEEFYKALLEKNLIYPCFTSEEELKNYSTKSNCFRAAASLYGSLV